MRIHSPNWDTLAKGSVKCGIVVLFVLAVCIALYFSPEAFRMLREKRVRYVYDAQKVVVDDSIKAFIEVLEREGLRVLNESRRQGGSGDWRTTAILVTENADGESDHCHVEVQGFVSHDAADQPIWTKNLPMTIRSRGQELDVRYMQLLMEVLDKHRWKYEVK